jgi:hypothetical protein
MDHVFQREGNAAKWHQNNGVARVDGALRDIQFLSHPRIGRSRGYDIPLSQMMVDSYQAGGLPPREGHARRWGGKRRRLGKGGKTARGKESDKAPIPSRT